MTSPTRPCRADAAPDFELLPMSKERIRLTQSRAGVIREHLVAIEARIAVGVPYPAVIEEFRAREIDLGSLASFPKALYRARKWARKAGQVPATAPQQNPPVKPSQAPVTVKQPTHFEWKGTGNRDDLV